VFDAGQWLLYDRKDRISDFYMAARQANPNAGRVLKSELLETADPVLADRNLRDIARINSWFGGHRALLRVLKGLAPRQKQFSLLDVGAGPGEMGKCIRQHFQNAMVLSLDHHTFRLPRTSGHGWRLTPSNYRSCRRLSISYFALQSCITFQIAK
jgi:hypothetical protein